VCIDFVSAILLIGASHCTICSYLEVGLHPPVSYWHICHR
jgi:hypothetical protein